MGYLSCGCWSLLGLCRVLVVLLGLFTLVGGDDCVWMCRVVWVGMSCLFGLLAVVTVCLIVGVVEFGVVSLFTVYCLSLRVVCCTILLRCCFDCCYVVLDVLIVLGYAFLCCVTFIVGFCLWVTLLLVVVSSDCFGL